MRRGERIAARSLGVAVGGVQHFALLGAQIEGGSGCWARLWHRGGGFEHDGRPPDGLSGLMNATQLL